MASSLNQQVYFIINLINDGRKYVQIIMLRKEMKYCDVCLIDWLIYSADFIA